jgi:hypothetical protein
MSSIQLFLGHEVLDDDLRNFGIEEEYIQSCLQPQIDFILVCNPLESNDGIYNIYNSQLYPILRNLRDNSPIDWEIKNFRGEEKLIAIFWH